MRRWVLWLNDVERRLWGDTLRGNAYFASLVMALSMFAGAALCERDMLARIAGSFVALNGVAAAGLLVMLFGFLLCESICVGRAVDIIIIRTLSLQLLSVLAAVLGYLLGWPLLLLSVMWLLAILVFVFLDLRR
ncbi:MAG: hypothetical protein IIW77_04615 [Bacteroidaceae bacterium]|nr:hypothetical protein [Bacteroidaceae bacterium]